MSSNSRILLYFSFFAFASSKKKKYRLGAKLLSFFSTFCRILVLDYALTNLGWSHSLTSLPQI